MPDLKEVEQMTPEEQFAAPTTPSLEETAKTEAETTEAEESDAEG